MNASPPRLPAAPPRSSLFWVLELSGWGLFGLGMFAAGVSHWPAGYAAAMKSSLTIFGFGASLLLRVIYRVLARRTSSLPVLVLAAIPLSFGAAALWMVAHNFAVAAYRSGLPGRSALAAGLSAFPDSVNTIYYFFLLLAWSALYFGVSAYLDLAAERERLLRAEALTQEARLSALKLQLNPHFLFNALNAVSTLVAEGRNAEANRMLARVASFLRRTLERPDAREVSLADEIADARRYLEIEAERFGDRLRVGIAIAPGAETARVPPLILQPLLENAVRHAVLAREDGGAIAIRAERRDGGLELEVEDDGPGLPDDGPRAAGIGLTNTRARLRELYGGDAELRLGTGRNGGLSVSIRIPFRGSEAAA